MFFRRWTEILTFSPGDAYVLRVPPEPVQYYAAIVNTLQVGVIFCLFTLLISRWRSGPLCRLSRMIWLLTLLKPLDAIRKVALETMPSIKHFLMQLIGDGRAPLLILAVGGLMALAFVFWTMSIYRAAWKALLILAPFVLVTLAQAGWKVLRYDAEPFRDKPVAAAIASGPSTKARIVWIVFDEMDQRLTFEKRYGGLELPELDRFRATSVYAAQAYPPSDRTLTSMPGLISGRMVIRQRPVDPSDISVRFSNATEPVLWSQQPNVFSRARQMGFNTALAGWYHPYCRVLAKDLTRCYWREGEMFINTTGERFAEVLWNQLSSALSWSADSSLRSKARIVHVRELLSEALKIAVDPSVGLALLHLQGSHSPFVYNRLTGRYDPGDPRKRGYNPKNYMDGAALTDLNLGELRREMEGAGVWKNTTVIISSDHWYREANEVDGKIDRRVPFMIKLSGQTTGATYERPFNTVLTHDLMLAILRGEVSTPQHVMSWLDEHRESTPIQPQL